MNVLLVEDEPIAQMVYQHYLKKLGHTIDLVVNGCDAIQKATMAITRPLYDLIILDIGLPGIDGETVIYRIRQYEATYFLKPLPIVVATAHSDQYKLSQYLLKGAMAVFSKPVTISTFQSIFTQLTVS